MTYPAENGPSGEPELPYAPYDLGELSHQAYGDPGRIRNLSHFLDNGESVAFSSRFNLRPVSRVCIDTSLGIVEGIQPRRPWSILLGVFEAQDP